MPIPVQAKVFDKRSLRTLSRFPPGPFIPDSGSVCHLGTALQTPQGIDAKRTRLDERYSENATFRRVVLHGCSRFIPDPFHLPSAAFDPTYPGTFSHLQALELQGVDPCFLQ